MSSSYNQSPQQRQMMSMAATMTSVGEASNDAPHPRGGWASSNAEFTREMKIPQRAVGKAIGRGGETIKRLKEEFSTFVQVDQTTSEQGFSTFKLSAATAESVEAAVAHLKGVVLSCEPCECIYVDDVEGAVEVPADKVGTVIGPQGCVLDEIRRRSGCRVQLQPVDVDDGTSPRSAKIVGTADAVRVCADLLNDVINGTFDVGSVINRQKAHNQRFKAGALGGGKGKGKGKGGGGYWNPNSSPRTAAAAAASGRGGGLSGGNMGQQSLNYTTSMGFVPPQVMYTSQQMYAADQGMISPHMSAANPGGPIPPYLMYAAYQQQQQQHSPTGGPGLSATEIAMQMQQQQQQPRSASQPATGPGNNQYIQQQQPLNMPVSPQGVITPQQVMAVHQMLRREYEQQQQQQQQNRATPEAADTSTPAVDPNSSGGGDQEEPL